MWSHDGRGSRDQLTRSSSGTVHCDLRYRHAVGLSAVMAAKIVGATRIIAVDVVPARLALAMELGATDSIDASAGNAAQVIKERTRYGVDFTFNTTRSPAIFAQAMESLAPRGVAGFVGAPLSPWTPDMFQILAGGRTLRGIIGGDSSAGSFIPLLIEYYRRGVCPSTGSSLYPFHEIARAFADCEQGTTIKAVLHPCSFRSVAMSSAPSAAGAPASRCFRRYTEPVVRCEPYSGIRARRSNRPASPAGSRAPRLSARPVAGKRRACSPSAHSLEDIGPRR